MAWQELVIIGSVAVLGFGIVVLTMLLYALLTGSHKRYTELKSQHREQRDRVKGAIQGKGKHE